MINPKEKKRRGYLFHYSEGVKEAFTNKEMDQIKKSSAYYRLGFEFGEELKLELENNNMQSLKGER
tara:strand:- start:565 stop:762 length:198 start_codon:yes stop_codon:yes gene_type:complete